jgi:hypothetical protein
LRAEIPPVRKAFEKDLAKIHAVTLRSWYVRRGYRANDQGADSVGLSGAPLPLDDGGTNATSDLVLIKSDPDHMLITQYQIKQTEEMSAGQTQQLEWPMPDSQVTGSMIDVTTIAKRRSRGPRRKRQSRNNRAPACGSRNLDHPGHSREGPWNLPGRRRWSVVTTMQHCRNAPGKIDLWPEKIELQLSKSTLPRTLIAARRARRD